jgi:hypothetical protein
MSDALHVGDRVRVGERYRLSRYLRGDQGTVVAVPDGRCWY